MALLRYRSTDSRSNDYRPFVATKSEGRDRPVIGMALLALVTVASLVFSSVPVVSLGASPAAAQPVQSCNDRVGGDSLLAAYTVKDSQLTHRKGTDCFTARRIWARFAKLIPARSRTMLTRFELTTRRNQGAEVFQNRNLKSWTLVVSLGLQPALDYILIHEFAHLLTLHPGQVPPVTAANGAFVARTCPTYFTGEGCSRDISLINQFVNLYWPQRHQNISERAPFDEQPPALYQMYPGRFVNDYAATNPGEDIAEVFATFVTQPRPVPTNVAERKVNFFWNRPRMMQLRREIRAQLG